MLALRETVLRFGRAAGRRQRRTGHLFSASAVSAPPFTPPLAGVRVLELEGIGPAPLAGCVLADFGASVVSVSRVSHGNVRSQNDPVSRGKRSIALDLKCPKSHATFTEMIRHADVLIEPFRPGVMEKLELGPSDVMDANERLVYARMTGWGQSGEEEVYSTAGHDSNYLALSGILDFFRRGDETPLPPANFAADYAGGGMILALGILVSLLERSKSGKGQVIDCAMTEGANYVGLPLFKWKQSGLLPSREDGHLHPQGSFVNQGPYWSRTYECRDGEWIAVQAIEPKFFAILMDRIGLGGDEDGSVPPQFDTDSWPSMTDRLAEIFKTKDRHEWAEIFRGSDGCVAPVLTPDEAARHPHNVARGSFAETPGRPGEYEPVPAPRLGRTPGFSPRPSPEPGQHTAEVLREYGIDEMDISELLASGSAVDTSNTTTQL